MGKNIYCVLQPQHKDWYKVKNEEIRSRADAILSRCNAINSKSGFKRFHPFLSYRGGKLFEYGAYDYESKKYVLNFAHSLKVDEDLKELDEFIQYSPRKPSKRRA